MNFTLAMSPVTGYGPAVFAPRPVARQAIYLHPGQLAVSAEPTVVTTILGSCVAVCVWDGASGIGGVNHFVLPFGAATDDGTFRFGNVATEELIGRVLGLGARRQGLRAKVFGGASISGAFPAGVEGTIGARNVERALLVLARQGVPVEASDTEGGRGRKLLFHTDDGSAWVKEL